MLIRILSLFYKNIKKNVSLLEDEYYYDDDPYDYDDMYDVYDFDDILIKLRTMPILMISTMTIMMISTMTIMMISGTMRTRNITGKRIIDLQPAIITGLQRETFLTLRVGDQHLTRETPLPYYFIML